MLQLWLNPALGGCAWDTAGKGPGLALSWERERMLVNRCADQSVLRATVLGSSVWTPPGPTGCHPAPGQPLRAFCAPVPADPPPQLVPAPNVTVSPGETAILSCRVLGEAPYNLTWVRDWRVLSASAGRVVQLANLSLEVSGIVPSDGGRYQCMASNANGVTRASVWLLVRGESLSAIAVFPVPRATWPFPQRPVSRPCAAMSPLAGASALPAFLNPPSLSLKAQT